VHVAALLGSASKCNLNTACLHTHLQLLCHHIEEAHQQQLEALQQQWLAAKAAAQQRNDEATAAARARCGHALWSVVSLFMQCVFCCGVFENDICRVPAPT
jgi:hypothetical protein